jgi:oxaloacetate decarboxylase alpha subunit
VLNVLSGKRWQVVPDEMKSYLRGRYGKAPGPVSREVLERVLGDEKPITVRPADLVDETLEQYAEEISGLARNEEDVITYALFPATARTYLEQRHHGAEEDVFLTDSDELESGVTMDVDKIKQLITAVEESSVAEVTIEEGDTRVTVRKGGETAPSEEAVPPVPPPSAAAPGVAEEADEFFAVKSPMVGTFYRAPSPTSDPFVEEGDEVTIGQTLCILEAMKLMNEVTSEIDGTVRRILVEDATPVEFGHTLLYIEPAQVDIESEVGVQARV